MLKLASPLNPFSKKAMLLGSGELGKEVVIELQRFGMEVIAVDRYANAPAMQVAHRHYVINMLDGARLREIIETERQIDNNLYEQMLQQADPYRATIRKKRQSFIWKGQFFEIDTFLEPLDNLVMMETKGVTEKETVNFPPFVKVLEDVTGNTRYLNYNLALKR